MTTPLALQRPSWNLRSRIGSVPPNGPLRFMAGTNLARPTTTIPGDIGIPRTVVSAR